MDVPDVPTSAASASRGRFCELCWSASVFGAGEAICKLVAAATFSGVSSDPVLTSVGGNITLGSDKIAR